MVSDPLTACQLIDGGAFEATGVAEVDVLQTGALSESSVFQASGQGTVFLPDPLSFHQDGQPILEVQIGAVGLLSLFLPGLGHAVELHGV